MACRKVKVDKRVVLHGYCMACRKVKVDFSEEEKQELLKAYDDGMNSVSQDRLPKIQDLASRFNKEEKEIKNWIGNERARRKRCHPTSDAPVAKKPPQKLRAPNSYNLFVKEFFKSVEGRSIPELADKNRAASAKWRELGDEEKDRYHQLATQVPTLPDTPGPSSLYDRWHETQRVLSNLQENCDWVEKFGLHVSYMLCNQKNHYVGGTKCGREFLESNPHLPASFLISTKPGITPTAPEPSTRKELKAQLQQQLNAKYSLAVGDSQARVPYTHLRPEHIIGLPPGITLQHPSMLSQEKLEAIYNNLSSIKFVGVPPKLPPPGSDHSYAKGSSNTRPKVLVPSHNSAPEYTTLSTKGANIDMLLNTQAETLTTCTIGQSVRLLSSSYTPISTAMTMTGDKVHGHEIPGGYVRIAVVNIDAGVKPLVQSDEEDLAKGSITAWPLKFMRKI